MVLGASSLLFNINLSEQAAILSRAFHLIVDADDFTSKLRFHGIQLNFVLTSDKAAVFSAPSVVLALMRSHNLHNIGST